LSNATCVVEPSRSITTADLTSTPSRPAVAIAASSGGMVASTTAQDEARNMNVLARNSASVSASPHDSGIKNSARVAAPCRATLFDLLDEQLRAGLGATRFVDQRRDAGHDGVLGAALHPYP
jgi:hypothetical protein